MKVLIVSLNYAPEPTGIAPYSAGLAEGLASLGHDVHVITGIPHYPEWRNTAGVKAWRATEEINGVAVTRLRHYIPAGGTGGRRALMEMTFAAGVLATRWGKPDIVISVSPALLASGVVVLASRLLRRLPLIVWVQDLYSRGVMELNGEAGLTAELVRRLESAVLRGASRVVVIHHRFGAFVTTRLNVPEDRLTEIRNWAHVDYEQNSSAAAALRQRYAWGDRPVALHCGSMGVKQGLDAVVRSARQAQEEGRRTLFVLMGDGSQRPHLEQLARGCSNIQLLPPLPADEFTAALNAADVLLLNQLPGVREMALPSKLTTYFTAGKPVVAAVDPKGTSADEMRAAGAGVVVPAGDSEAMLNAIDLLVANPAVCAELGARGQHYANENLNRAGVLHHWDTLLTTVAGRAPRGVATAEVDALGTDGVMPPRPYHRADFRRERLAARR